MTVSLESKYGGPSWTRTSDQRIMSPIKRLNNQQQRATTNNNHQRKPFITRGLR